MLYNTVVVSGQQRALSPKDPKIVLIWASVMPELVMKGVSVAS
jgi:hypothetical protein